MTSPSASRPPVHNVLQLHGGGALTLAQLIKCAVLEQTTGKRIPALFPSIIADSGGAVIALCLHQKPATDILPFYMDVIAKALPSRKFLMAQPLPKTPDRFDSTPLRNAISGILGKKTLGDLGGNIFIRTHSMTEKATRISKCHSSRSGQFCIENANASTELLTVAMAASAIPGILPEEDELTDPLTDQNPVPVLVRLGQAYPETSLRYVQVGNIHSNNTHERLKKITFIRALITGTLHAYAAIHSHTAHLEDALDVLPKDKIVSLLTYGEGKFSSIDNSPEQRTRLTVATLNDIETRAEDYAKLCLDLSERDITPEALAETVTAVKESIKALRAMLDPYMIKEKVVVENTADVASLEKTFPSPHYIEETRTLRYRTGYIAGFLLKQFQKKTAKDLTAFWNATLSAAQSIADAAVPTLLPNTTSVSSGEFRDSRHDTDQTPAP